MIGHAAELGAAPQAPESPLSRRLLLRVSRHLRVLRPLRFSRHLRRPALAGTLLMVGVLVGQAGATGLAGWGGAGGVAGAATAQPPAAPNSDLSEVYTDGGLISEPFVLPTSTVDYLYSSGLGGSPHVPVHSFVDMGTWQKTEDAMPTPPSWAVSTAGIWAPDVRKVGGRYVMWFSAQASSTPPGSPAKQLRCLGWATSNSPLGPFVSTQSAPALCQYSDFGDIDPRTIMVGSQEYLLWKSNNNAAPDPTGPTTLYSQRLGPNGTTLKGTASALMHTSAPWEGTVIESPDMVSYDGQYYLFFSMTDGAASPAAGIGVATCSGPTGPCSDRYQGPWLGSNTHGAGPCEESLFQQDGATWILYSPWANYTKKLYPVVAASRVGFGAHLPYVASFDGAKPGP